MRGQKIKEGKGKNGGEPSNIFFRCNAFRLVVLAITLAGH
jgi:hypothetical protein